ncbi:exodeoxyribonuclease VII large subunit [Rhodobacteraceae bacterium XHP0102]|nr:exodeoxyribonuclease VII large subunit [Rhodobacteraceae bacterium XHP0102]
MSDLIEDTEGGNAPEFSVSEISGAVKRMIEGGFSYIRVRGELGRISRPASGHIYLTLKDDRANLDAVIWKGTAARLAHRPEEGMEVIATGRMTTFPGQSKYQLVIEDMRPAGAGALMAMLEQRRVKLAAEGLFDAARKQELPFLPEVIGVVTSPSGAVIRDILHRLRDRFPREVLIWPVAVQGEKCAPEVAAGIRGFNALAPDGPLPRPDLIIVARGGGSLEDLWGFNEEIVVRAAAESMIPLISAVGHETDTTLIDFAADYRAPTPTAAAERAVPVRMDILNWVQDCGARLSRGAQATVAQRRVRLTDLSRALPRPASLLESAQQRLDRIADRLEPALVQSVQTRHHRLQTLGARLPPALDRALTQKRLPFERASAHLRPSVLTRAIADAQQKLAALERMRQSLGYTATLKRGYAVLREGEALITTASGVKAASQIEIELADGVAQVKPLP